MIVKILLLLLSFTCLVLSFVDIGLQFIAWSEDPMEPFMEYNMRFYNRNGLTLLATVSYLIITIFTIISIKEKRERGQDFKVNFFFMFLISAAVVQHYFYIKSLLDAKEMNVFDIYYVFLGINIALAILILFQGSPKVRGHSKILDNFEEI